MEVKTTIIQLPAGVTIDKAELERRVQLVLAKRFTPTLHDFPQGEDDFDEMEWFDYDDPTDIFGEECSCSECTSQDEFGSYEEIHEAPRPVAEPAEKFAVFGTFVLNDNADQYIDQIEKLLQDYGMPVDNVEDLTELYSLREFGFITNETITYKDLIDFYQYYGKCFDVFEVKIYAVGSTPLVGIKM